MERARDRLHLRRTTEQHVPEVEVQVKRRRTASLSNQDWSIVTSSVCKSAMPPPTSLEVPRGSYCVGGLGGPFGPRGLLLVGKVNYICPILLEPFSCAASVWTRPYSRCQLYPRRSQQQQVPVVDFQAELRQAFLAETPRGG